MRRIHAKFAALNLNSNGDEGDWASSAPPILGEEDIDDVVDDRPWQPHASGIELGEENAADCLRWMSQKVLEHVGFQGKTMTSFPLSRLISVHAKVQPKRPWTCLPVWPLSTC